MEEKDNIIEQDILEDNNIDNKIEKSEILLEQDENLVNNNEKKDNLLLRQTTITDPTLLSPPLSPGFSRRTGDPCYV